MKSHHSLFGNFRLHFPIPPKSPLPHFPTQKKPHFRGSASGLVNLVQGLSWLGVGLVSTLAPCDNGSENKAKESTDEKTD